MSARGRRGFVLVGVLWLATLLAALVVAAQTGFRSFTGVAAVSRDKAVADALIVAGLELAAGLAPSVREPLTSAITLETGSVTLSIADAAGRIDLSRAPVPVLAGLMRAAGAAPDEAETLARRIADWRDPDDERLPGGAEAADYEAAGVPVRPADAPFGDVSQLRFVLGMPAGVAEAARDLSTVDGRAAVDPSTAPLEVLAALPGVTAADAAAVVRLRRERPGDDGALLARLGAAARYVEIAPPRAFLVDLRAVTRAGLTVEAQATIALLAGDRQPYRVVRWTPLS